MSEKKGAVIAVQAEAYSFLQMCLSLGNSSETLQMTYRHRLATLAVGGQGSGDTCACTYQPQGQLYIPLQPSGTVWLAVASEGQVHVPVLLRIFGATGWGDRSKTVGRGCPTGQGCGR